MAFAKFFLDVVGSAAAATLLLVGAMKLLMIAQGKPVEKPQ